MSQEAPIAVKWHRESWFRFSKRRWGDNRLSGTTAVNRLGTAAATWLDTKCRSIGLGEYAGSTVDKTTRLLHYNGAIGNNGDRQAR
jgi:hypothetical protein